MGKLRLLGLTGALLVTGTSIGIGAGKVGAEGLVNPSTNIVKIGNHIVELKDDAIHILGEERNSSVLNAGLELGNAYKEVSSKLENVSPKEVKELGNGLVDEAKKLKVSDLKVSIKEVVNKEETTNKTEVAVSEEGVTEGKKVVINEQESGNNTNTDTYIKEGNKEEVEVEVSGGKEHKDLLVEDKEEVIEDVEVEVTEDKEETEVEETKSKPINKEELVEDKVVVSDTEVEVGKQVELENEIITVEKDKTIAVTTKTSVENKATKPIKEPKEEKVVEEVNEEVVQEQVQEEQVSEPIQEVIEETPETLVVEPQEPQVQEPVVEVVEDVQEVIEEPVIEVVEDVEVTPSIPVVNQTSGGSYGTNYYTKGTCAYWAFERRKQLGYGVSNLWGNGYNWANGAISNGYTVNNQAQVGSIIQSGAYQNGAGSLGHVAIVEEVYPDGSILVSEMGWNGSTSVTHRVLSNYEASQHNFIH